ncbi:GntR family transcriptional regulator [Roseomonas nepalensis]|uniref:GntR family transcriptional regulator n=1 Tax=Muricoccus nepalensis TaxID=1854500 RepID=A0A502EN86_9PROT|nr:GntR family transcriptional regulator [Roseomonas nepalensis]TPG39208.1 GntR family transcriptional regulator [Roseomonas nepalensis]
MDLRVTPLGVQSQAVDKLREAIVSGHFQPGQRLVEAELCRLLGISRGSVREALRRLEGERLVVITPNRGPSVTELSWEEAVQIYDVRRLLEGEAAALAARRATAAQREEMEAALEAFEAAVAAEDALGRVGATACFYDLVLAACGNAVVDEILRGLHARINLLRSRSMSRQGRAPESARELRAILAAIRDRAPAAARKAAMLHVQAACAAAKEAMAERRVA